MTWEMLINLSCEHFHAHGRWPECIGVTPKQFDAVTAGLRQLHGHTFNEASWRSDPRVNGVPIKIIEA